MSNEIFGEISDLMMSAEGPVHSEFAGKVNEIIENFENERELYLQNIILELERLRINGQINAVQNAKVLDKAIAELSGSPESEDRNKRFLRSIRENQHIRELFLPNKPNMAEEIQKDPDFLMSREQLEYGKATGREIDLYIPGYLPGGNFLEMAKKAFDGPEIDLKINIEPIHKYFVVTGRRPTSNYHLLIENNPKLEVSSTKVVGQRILDENNNIPENTDLVYQGLNRVEFLYYCLYTHVEGSYNGIEIGVQPTLIQNVEFKDGQGNTKAFLSGETSLNSLDFRLANPASIHRLHLPLAKAPKSLP